jgi:hypothetical protein
VHFENKHAFLFGQDHFMSRGLVDMTQAGNNLVKESYIIQIPDNALGKDLSVYIGLYSPTSQVRFNVLNAPATGDRYYLGRI